MKLFVARFYNESDSSQGAEWFTTERAAKAALSRFATREDVNYDSERSSVDTYDFGLTKKGVLDLLNMVATHPDNG